MFMKLDSDSTPAITNVAVVSTISRSDSRSPSISASASRVMRSSDGLRRRFSTSSAMNAPSAANAWFISGVRPRLALSVEIDSTTLRRMSTGSASGNPSICSSTRTVIRLE